MENSLGCFLPALEPLPLSSTGSTLRSTSMAHIGGGIIVVGAFIITFGDVSCGMVDKLDATCVVADVRGRWDEPVPLLAAMVAAAAATIAGSQTYPAMYKARAAAFCAM